MSYCCCCCSVVIVSGSLWSCMNTLLLVRYSCMTCLHTECRRSLPWPHARCLTPIASGGCPRALPQSIGHPVFSVDATSLQCKHACVCRHTRMQARFGTPQKVPWNIKAEQSKAKQSKQNTTMATIMVPKITAEAAVACAAAEAEFSNSQKFGLWHDTAECGFETHPLRKTH